MLNHFSIPLSSGVTLSTVTTPPQTPPCNETVDPDCVNGTDSGEEISNDTEQGGDEIDTGDDQGNALVRSATIGFNR